MKRFILTTLIVLLSNAILKAQEIKGKILINNNSKQRIELEKTEVVNLYARLRDKIYSINFQFEGSNLPTTTEGKQVSLIEFNTIVKYNGKIINNKKRQPMPLFPGSMFMPIETFDLISILISPNNSRGTPGNSKMPKGIYEVIFEAKSLDARGSIQPATLVFEIK